MTPSTFRCAYLLGPSQIELRDISGRPPGEGELLIEIEAATTCGTDVKVYRRGGHPRMLTPPCPFGHEMAGTVVDTGMHVSGWRAGDRVVVANSAPCGGCSPCRAGRENLCEDLAYLNGAFAERLIVPARFSGRSVYHLPSHVEADLGALAEPLACVVHGFDRMRLPAASDVLVLGGGPIGLMFVYLLTLHSHRVCLADPHATRLELARALGATHTHRIVERASLADELNGLSVSARGFDAAIDATGTAAGWSAAVDAVQPGGVVNFFGGCAPGTEITLDTHRAHYSEITLHGCYHHRPATFARAIEILSQPVQPLSRLVTFDCPLDEVERALLAMIERRALKVAIRPRAVASTA